MSSHDIPCGLCGAVTAYDQGCPGCRVPDPDPIEMTAADIQAFRAEHKLSQPMLSALLPVSLYTLRNWEQGRTEQPPDYLRRALRDLERELTSQPPG